VREPVPTTVYVNTGTLLKDVLSIAGLSLKEF
jgi:hypothetical protein